MKRNDLAGSSKASNEAKKKSVFTHAIPPKAAVLTGLAIVQPDTASDSSNTNKNTVLSSEIGPRVVEVETKVAANTEQLPTSISRIPQPTVHKPPRVPKLSPLPHQTRTTTLRARLSSGSADKNAPVSTSVTPFADNTFLKSKPAEESTRKSYVKRGKPFPDGSRAPARMIAGSRRPSRGVHQTDPTTLQSNCSTSLPSAVRTSDSTSLLHKSSVCAEPGNAETLCSVSPAYETTNLKLPNKDTQYYELDDTSPSTPTVTTLKPTERLNHSIDREFAVYEELRKDGAPIHTNSMGIAIPVTTNSIGSGVSAPVTTEAWRGRAYTMKRLSRVAPTHGPTLWISPSADRLIMGEGSDKENISSPARKNTDLRCVITRKEFGKSQEGATLRSHTVSELNRPLTSQGLVHSYSQDELDTGYFCRKRARTINMDYRLSDLAVSTRSTITSIGEDPFFDAKSHLEDIKVVDDRSEAASQHQRQSLYEDAIVGESSWISALPERARSTKPRRAPPSVSRLRSALHPDDPNQSATNTPTRNDIKDDGIPISQEQVPKTPTRAELEAASSPETFPPRSSSRTPVPDYTVNESAPAFSEKYPAKEMVLLREDVDQDSTGTVSFCSEAACDVPKRSSTAQGSTTSQASTTKGVFSNVRGFFHKRTSEKSLPGLSSKNVVGRSKTSINLKDIPFPPVSDVQRLHRPKVSSKNRNVSKAKRGQSMSMVLDTPILESPRKSELSNNTALAMDILKTARQEPSTPKKERLLELGKIMVNALTQARDAEKAMEEAKQAARKAEISYMLCTSSVSEITKNIQDWRRELQKAD